MLTPEVKVSLAASAPSGLTWASVFDQLSCAMHGCIAAGLLHSGNGGRTLERGQPWPTATRMNARATASCSRLRRTAPPWAATGRNGAACAPAVRPGCTSTVPSGWEQLPPWQLTQITALAAVSQDVAYALSDRGVLSRTRRRRAGLDPAAPRPAPGRPGRRAEPGTALAAQDQADAGAILRSDNGGRSWNEISHLPGVVTRLDFWSADDGVAAIVPAGRRITLAALGHLGRRLDLGALRPPARG